MENQEEPVIAVIPDNSGTVDLELLQSAVKELGSTVETVEVRGRTVLVVGAGRLSGLSGATMAALLASKLGDDMVLVHEGDIADRHADIVPLELRIDAAALEKHCIVTLTDGQLYPPKQQKRTKQWLSPWATIGKQRGTRQQHHARHRPQKR